MQHAMEKYFREKTGMTLQIEKIGLNPYTLELDITNTVVQDRDRQQLLALDDLTVNVSLSGLFRRAWVIQQLNITGPQLQLIHYGKGVTNLSQLIPAAPSGDGNSPRLPAVFIDNIKLIRGYVRLADRAITPAASIILDQIDMTAQNIATRAEENGVVALTIGDAAKGKFSLKGELNVAELTSNGSFEFSGLNPGILQPWIKDLVADVEVDGRVRVNGDFSLNGKLDKPGLLINKLYLDANDLRLKTPEAPDPLLSLGRVQLSGGSLDLQKRGMRLADIRVKGGTTEFKLLGTDSNNWSGLMDPISAVNSAGAARPAWSVHVDKITTDGIKVSVVDARKEQPVEVTLDDIRLHIENLDSTAQQQSEFKVTMSINTNGRMESSGWFEVSTPEIQAALALADVDIKTLNPYLKSTTILQFKSGLVSANFDANYRSGAAMMNGQIEGKDFQLVEPGDVDPVVSMKGFSAAGVTLQGRPWAAAIKKVVLHEPYSSIEINPENHLNLSAWWAPEQDVETDTGETGKNQVPRVSMVIDRIEIDSGNIDFSDLSLSPRFTVTMEELNGAFTGFSLEKNRAVAMTLKGRINEYASTAISGRLRPFDATRNSEVNMNIRNLDTSVLSAYSARFAGRQIKSGKLNMDLNYLVKNGNLDGHHEIELIDFVLGDRVESPQALDLPLDMAIALLKDRDGRINLSIPVAGTLEDPKFDLRRVIGAAVSKLLTGMVSAPFKLLGSLIGSSNKNINSIPFEPGSAAITPPALETITELSKALKDRPGLALRASGSYDPKLDHDLLARQRLSLQIIQAAGLESADSSFPSHIAFTDPNIQKVLDDFALSRLDMEKLDLIRKDLEENSAPAGQEDAGVNREAYYERIFNTLAMVEDIPAADLKLLAHHRAQSIATQFEHLGLEQDRIKIDEEVKTVTSKTRQVVVKLVAETTSKRGR